MPYKLRKTKCLIKLKKNEKPYKIKKKRNAL